jgi:ribonucleoside-triphosphate reductase
MDKFRLTDSFLDKYKRQKPPFGFDGLGELVYLRTYSRLKPNGENERWWETVQRVVEGTFNMQKKWIDGHRLGWHAIKAQKSAQEMYERIFTMKFLPPGRGLWAMGSPITEERGLYMALNNCAFCSTANIKEDLSKSFCFLMDVSMVGVGCGFDVKGEGKIEVFKPAESDENVYKIPDTREGWVESVRLLIDSYLLGTKEFRFDYSEIRGAGQPIKGFGGVSSGAEPLKELHKGIRGTLKKNFGKPITITSIVDIMNMIGKCVVAGNVRRTAEIVFGDFRSQEYLDLKNYSVNSYREDFGWTSNNSIFAELGMNYADSVKRTQTNGEPGYAWLYNMQSYSRMNNGPDFKDHRVEGGNPCLEQSLESYEVCNLVETFPHNHESLDDFLITLKYAYLYAKTVTLGETHWPETNRVMLRNRRIGCSMSGIAQFVTDRGLHELKKWCEEGYKKIEYYDEVYADWLAIPKSIKKTSIKPSGTVSLLAGATPGVHYPENVCYIRRMRLSKHSDLVGPLEDAGYKLEPCYGSEDSTVVVEVPVRISDHIRAVRDVSVWEQAALSAFMQRYWADNQVSCTITFTKAEAMQLEPVLNFYQYQLKGISFLPFTEEKVYRQMPYESITNKRYEELSSRLRPIKFKGIKNEEAEVEKFCSNDVCEIKAVKKKL